MRIKVQVNNTDIKSGKKCHAKRCPIALALKPLLKIEYRVDKLQLSKGKIKTYAKTKRRKFPLKAQSFIEKFDSGEKVKPFNFYIDVPKTWLK